MMFLFVVAIVYGNIDIANKHVKDYKYANGRKEIVFGIYYSGPYDCSGFQYAIALNAAMTEKMAQQKILNFIENNVSIITF